MIYVVIHEQSLNYVVDPRYKPYNFREYLQFFELSRPYKLHILIDQPDYIQDSLLSLPWASILWSVTMSMTQHVMVMYLINSWLSVITNCATNRSLRESGKIRNTCLLRFRFALNTMAASVVSNLDRRILSQINAKTKTTIISMSHRKGCGEQRGKSPHIWIRKSDHQRSYVL